MNYRLFKPNNGLSVIIVDTKSFPSVTVLLLIGAGSRYEQSENNGIAHFFEHMAFKGSKKYPSSFAISSTIDSIGGQNNAFTAKDYTGYYIKGAVDKFDTMLDVLSDMIQNPLLDVLEMEKEKRVIKQEIAMYEDMPHKRVAELYESMIYKGSSLGFDIAGTKEIVSSFTRDMVLDYMNKWYSPNNAVLVVAGGLDKVIDYESHVKNYFSTWRGREIKKRYAKIKETKFEPKIEVYEKKTEQIHICIGYRTFGRHDRRKYALFVLSAILGGGMSSRLFMELREERGLCYYISTHAHLHDEIGHLTTQAGIRTGTQSYEQAISLIKDEHRRIAKEGIKNEELARVKAMVKGNTMLSLESSSYIASVFGLNYLFYNKMITPVAEMNKIQAVTKDEVDSVARDIIKDEGLNICAIK